MNKGQAIGFSGRDVTDKSKQSVSERILSLLTSNKKYSQKELANNIGVAPSTLSNWLLKGRNIPSDKIIPISKYFGIAVDDLLGGSTDIPEREKRLYPDYAYLRSLRESRQITQETMASILGYSSKGSYSLIESGKQAITTPIASAISTALGMSKDEFIRAFFPSLFQTEDAYFATLESRNVLDEGMNFKGTLSISDRKYRISLSITPSGEELNG